MNADFIIGIGGGSPLDASKAAAIYASNPKMKPLEIYTRTDTNAPLPLVLVGTTAGTGSEVTGVAVLTDSENGMKRSISGKDCYAKTAFCDYGYTMSVPYDFTVSTALDALAHTVESYFSKVSNSMSELYAEKALPLLWENLKKLDKNKNTPDETMREELYIGSIYAGLALNITGTCFPHTMGYVLTEDFNIPHGKACTAFMTDYLNIAVRQLPEKAERLFSVAGTDFSEFTATVDRLTDVRISMTEEQIEQYGERWAAPVKNFNRTPGNFTKDTAVKILEKYLK
ncbi:MAG: iron-containing alcohol dehydrogenase, partial [Clostridiales bacterium]|nr:iron-containing alcohol dehydrogenase [Clostridiales bacterium]